MAFTSESFVNGAPLESHLSQPLEALTFINQHIYESESLDSSLRAINFMSYELATLCSGSLGLNALPVLNEFVFESKKFRIATEPVLLDQILTERRGCGMALALLYIHLARPLGVHLQMVHWPLHTVLKWEGDDCSKFIDLEQKGKILCEEELLKMINRHRDQLRVLSEEQAIVQYLSYISTHFRQNDDSESLHKTLCLILRLEPENTRYLAERAILRRNLGLFKESLSDFKRYFAFNDVATASPDVVSVYESVRLLNP